MKVALKEMNGLMRDGLLTLALGLLALFALFGTGWIANMSFDGEGSVAVAYEDDPIKDRIIIDFSTDEKYNPGVVKYRFYGEELPEKLHPDEVVSLRNDGSYTVLIGIENEGTPQEKKIYNTVSFAKGTFIQEGSTWRYVEHGRTSKENFERKLQQVRRLPRIIPIAHAVDYAPNAADGNIYNSVSATSTSQIAWNVVHNALTGNASSTDGQFITVSSEIIVFKSTVVGISRGFLTFDTSSIPAGATISAASLSVYGTTTNACVALFPGYDNDGNDFVTVVQTSQAAHTGLLYTDYDQAGAITNPTEGIDSGNRKDLSSGGYATTSAGVSALNTFTLNSTGMGWIKKSGQSSNCGVTSGITCLGLREGHDVLNNLPADGTSSVACSVASDYTGTSIDPYLSVTYSLPGGAFWQFQDY